MTSTLTNKLNIIIDYDAIYKDFKVLSKKFDPNANVKSKSIEIRKLQKSIDMTLYIAYGNQIIYLIDKKEAIIDEDSILIPVHKFKEIPAYMIMNMLLKILVKRESFFDTHTPFNKLNYFVRKYRGVIETVEFYIDKRNHFLVNSVAFKEYNQDSKKNNFAPSLYKRNGNLLELTKDIKSKEPLYMKGNYKGRKITVKYFSKFHKDYHLTKSYFAGMLITSVKEHLSSYLKFEFQSLQMKHVLNYTQSYIDKKDKELISVMNDKIKSLNIINLTDIDTLKIIPYIKEVISDVKINIKDKPSDNEFNLIFLYDKGYYEKYKKADPYDEMKKITPYSQMLQVDSVIELNRHKIKISIKELLVKDDIKNKSLHIAKETNIKSVFKYIKTDNEDLVYEIQINNGKIRFQSYTSGKYHKLLCVDAKSSGYGECDTIIEDKEGNISAIIDTKTYGIVNYEGMYQYYNSGEPNGNWYPLRKKDDNVKKLKSKYHLVEGIYGFKTFLIDSFDAYIVGKQKNTQDLGRNSPARLIYPLVGDGIDKKEVISAMQYFFIKNKELTVMPYQVKYLREAININSVLDVFSGS